MLYKQAWYELKHYIKIVKVTTTDWDSPEESAMRDKILEEMRRLEKRWKIIPQKKAIEERDNERS